MHTFPIRSRLAKGAWMAAAALWLAGCALGTRPDAPPLALRGAPPDALTQLRWLDRVSWGANASGQAEVAKQGLAEWMGRQLEPVPQPLPPEAQAQIDAMEIARTPVSQLAIGLDTERKVASAMTDEDQRKAANQAYQQHLNRLATEARQRFVLRALYSPNQLQEQMTWFWTNHFNISLRKGDLRALVGDYEENAIRLHALGRFRDLLGATLRHPAMLSYLDNAQNAANRINENYARELMELHTLGVGGGYSQHDVQELARVLTGVGVSLQPVDAPPPKLKAEIAADYRREGLFEFNPNRHDYGSKMLLSEPIRGRGLAEVDEALDRLSRAPATARFSRASLPSTSWPTIRRTHSSSAWPRASRAATAISPPRCARCSSRPNSRLR